MSIPFKNHDLESAPEQSKPLLEKSIKGFGMIPNLHAVMAESPSLLEAYQIVHGLFSNSSFNKEELTVVWQTINVEHECHYCVPAHALIAQMMEVDTSLTESLRNSQAMPNEKLQVLQDTTLIIVRNRGKITEEEMEIFYTAGYTQQQLLDIVLGVSQKVMSNYTNHIAKTSVDEAFAPFQ